MLKSEKRSNSPNKTSDDCYRMKFDLSDNQLLHKKEHEHISIDGRI